MPAEWTEPSSPPHVGVTPDRVQRRADRRTEQREARRSRRLWAIASCIVLACAFGLTVGILDVIR